MVTHRLFSYTLAASTLAAVAQVALCQGDALAAYAPAIALSAASVPDAPHCAAEVAVRKD